jgi:hypothetical protein
MPAAAPAVGSRTPLRYLPLALRVPRSPLKAVAIGWLTAFPLSILLAFLGSLLFPDAAQPEFQVDGTAAVIALVVVAPAIETLIMGVALLVVLLFLRPATAIIVSAIGWGIAHSLIAPIWGFVIWWPFLVFSTLFVTWRSRSLVLAFLLPFAVHGLQNLVPALMLANGTGI